MPIPAEVGEGEDRDAVPNRKCGSVLKPSLNNPRSNPWRKREASLPMVGFAALISDNLPNTAASPELALPMMIGLSKVSFGVTP